MFNTYDKGTSVCDSSVVQECLGIGYTNTLDSHATYQKGMVLIHDWGT